MLPRHTDNSPSRKERDVSERLNVTHVVLSLDVGGLERNVVNQIREGEKLGQRVSIVCIERPGTLAAKAESLGARLVSLDKRPGLRPRIIARLRASFRELRPDVVHTHQIGPLLYTGPAIRSLRIPLLVHTEHGKANYDRLKTRWLGRLGAYFVDRFYCLSEDMATAVSAHRIVNPRKLAVIANGIDTACYTEAGGSEEVRRTLGIPNSAPVIGTVGRLNEIKRQDVLIRAFAMVRECVPDAHLMLVGDGPLGRELRALRDRLGLAAFVHFAGYQELTAPYLQAMNCFALPSRSEGMPQSLLEACAAGVPVIAARVGGIPEVIEHERTGLLVETGDAKALADGLLQLLGSPERSRILSEAARLKVLARYHIRRMVGDYHRDYLEMLGRKASWKRSQLLHAN